MKILEVVQGTPEWKMAQAGMPTASCFHRIISAKTLKPSTTGAETYLNELLAEWSLGIFEGEDGSDFMDRGREMEQDAIEWFELQTGLEVERVGFITDDAGTVGCSPDGLMGEDRGLEVKCLKAAKHIGFLRALGSGDLSPYMAQMQGALWISGRKTWTWLGFHPTLPPEVVTVARDEKFIAALAAAIGAFNAELAAAKADLLKRGVVPAIEAAAPGGTKLSSAVMTGNLNT